MSENLKPDDKVLLMKDEGDNKLKVVKSINKNGKIDAVHPSKANLGDLLKIDQHSDILTNFFKNFIEQSKNPSHTGFFAVAVNMLDKVITMNDSDLEKLRINPYTFINQQKNNVMETNVEEQRKEFKQMDISNIPDAEYKKLGVTPESIKDELNAMSWGFKSPHLVDMNLKIDDGEPLKIQGRLALEEQPDGSLRFKTFPRQETVDLDKPFMGVMLPDDVKENLLTNGNGGRVVNVINEKGEVTPSLISVDKLTNRIEAVAVDNINVREKIKGVELTAEQQQEIKDGKKVLVEGMSTRKTVGTEKPKLFDAYVQYNAAKGQYDFSYDGLDRNRYKQDKKQEQSDDTQNNNKVRIPSKLLGATLDEKQQNDLRENRTIFVKGMTDKKGQPFNAYIKVNTEKGKLDFFKWNPDRAKKQGAEVTPANESRTQVAVNSEGKTNEATKNVKEPLNKGQQRPTAAQKQEQGDKKKVSRPKSMKV
jgi:hypothetical protein